MYITWGDAEIVRGDPNTLGPIQKTSNTFDRSQLTLISSIHPSNNIYNTSNLASSLKSFGYPKYHLSRYLFDPLVLLIPFLHPNYPLLDSRNLYTTNYSKNAATTVLPLQLCVSNATSSSNA